MAGNFWGDQEQYDAAMMTVLRDCGKIQQFLECVFSFLSRRTDFFIIMEHQMAEMGFAPGVAMNMVVQAFKKYEILTRKRETELMREVETRKIDMMTDDLSQEPKLDTNTAQHMSKLAKLQMAETEEELPNEDEEVPTSESSEMVPVSTDEPCAEDNVAEKTVTEPPPETSEPPPQVVPSPPAAETTEPAKTAEKPTVVVSIPSPIMDKSKLMEVLDNKAPLPGSAIPGAPENPTGSTDRSLPLTKKEEQLLQPDTYNGSSLDNYSWSQTMSDIDIKIPAPVGTTGRDIKVEIKADHLKVELVRPTKRVILDGKLLNKIKAEDSLWSYDKAAGSVLVNLEKGKEIMWKSVFEGEEGIDLSKVDTTRSLSEFDEEAQAAIERVTFDHHMKMLGKPTSSEQKAHDILKKAWDAPGSPFKGTPFDPSRVNIAGVW